MKILNKFFKNNNILKKISALYLLTKSSLKYKLIASFLFVILLPTLLYTVYSYTTISSSYEKNLKTNLISFTEETASNINHQFDYIKNTALSLLVNSNILDLLDSTPSSNIDKVIAQSKFEHEVNPFLLFNPAWENKTLLSLFLFKDLENFYYVAKEHSVTTIDESKFIMQNLINKNQFPITVQSPTKENVFYIVRECFDLETSKRKGFLLLEIDSSLIFDFEKLMSIYPNLKFIAHDTISNKVISSSIEDVSGKTIPNDFLQSIDKHITEKYLNTNKYFITNNSISGAPLNLITLIPESDIFTSSTNPKLKFILMFLILTGICIKFYFILYRGISDPLNDIFTHIQAVKEGDLTTKMPTYEYTELNDVSTIFNKMTGEIDILINQVYDKQLLITESELKFLKSQMDPHFIFNVLDTINWHAKLDNNNTICDLTTNLSKLLRANINFSGNEFISVREELEYIDYYITLQKTRFEDRLNVNISIADDSLLDCKIPKLCLQPLVENAIIHGLEPKIEGGTISLQVWEEDNTICFNIIDNGIGFNIDLIEKDSTPIDSRKKGHNSIALDNIKRRLELLYGSDHSINITSTIGKGSKVTIILPLQEEDLNVQSTNC